SGRVEHLSSGRTAHFASLGDLLAFFAAILDAPGPTVPPGVTDGCPTGAPAGPEPPRGARRRDRAPRPVVRRGQSTTGARGRSTRRPAPDHRPLTPTERREKR